MKNKRQEMILDIIARYPVETQEELIAKLRENGFSCTQSTISRDIKQLHLVKELSDGAYRYAVSKTKAELDSSDRLQRILHECCTGCDYAQNLVVLKTMPGLASAAGAALDAKIDPLMLGCVCGDDTVVIIMRTESAAQDLYLEIQQICK
ncbi:MAG: arginine repressor [Ruminococcaceae bacterium]|nr:arginine repressor [Oscillospiraceae bacterium]